MAQLTSKLQPNQSRSSLLFNLPIQLIEASHKIVAGRPDKSYAIGEELSPDALFMRSTLQIEGAEFSDFGLYNCTITNMLGIDSMAIFLQPTASTGKFRSHIARARAGQSWDHSWLVGFV